MNKLQFYFLIIISTVSFSGLAQNFNLNMSATNGGYTTFSTLDELNQGKAQINQVNLQITKGGGASPGPGDWKITVRVLDDFRNLQDNSATVNANYGQLTLNQISNSGQGQNSVSSGTVPLSTNEVDLAIGTSDLNNNTTTEIRFNLNILGGEHLYVENGNYRTTYEFRLYFRNNPNQAYQEITVILTNGAGFNIDYNGNYGVQSIVLQNGASINSFNFNDVSDYTNGKTIEVINGLKVVSGETYQIMVRSSNAEFLSESNSHSIPVSILRLESSSNTPIDNVQFFGPFSISPSDQTLINRTATNPQEIEYNLRFIIPPNSFSPPIFEGNYKTYLYLSIVPN